MQQDEGEEETRLEGQSEQNAEIACEAAQNALSIVRNKLEAYRKQNEDCPRLVSELLSLFEEWIAEAEKEV